MSATTSNPSIHIPTENDLPYDDNEKMESSRHKYQMDLLLETIYPWLEKSWVVWQEGKAPDLVIELLSDSTASYDKNQKKLFIKTK